MAARRGFNISDATNAAIGLGLINGVKEYGVYGVRAGIGADLETDISQLVATVVPLPANAGQQLEIVSSDPIDMQTIELQLLGPGAVYLDPITVQLNGTTPVLLSAALVSRINDGWNISATPFIGQVNIQAQGGGTIFETLLALDQEINTARFTIPAGKKWLVKRLIGTMERSGGSENSVSVSLLVKQFDSTTWMRIFSFGLQRSGSSSISFENDYPTVRSGPVDIRLTAKATAAAQRFRPGCRAYYFDL